MENRALNNRYINEIKNFPGLIFSGKDYANAVPYFKLPVLLDVGCGNGEALVHEAQNNPDKFYVGIELQYKEVYRTVIKIKKLSLNNCLLLQADAAKVPDLFGPGQIAGVNIFFPDPWPKTKHKKNRLVTTSYLRRLFGKMLPGSFVKIRTDNDDYFMHMLSVIYPLRDEFGLEMTEFSRDHYRYGNKHGACITAFERIFIRQGLLINSLYFKVNKPL